MRSRSSRSSRGSRGSRSSRLIQKAPLVFPFLVFSFCIPLYLIHLSLSKEADTILEGQFKQMTEEEIAVMVSNNRKTNYAKQTGH